MATPKCPSCFAGGQNIEVRGGGVIWCNVEQRLTGRWHQGNAVAMSEQELAETTVRPVVRAGWYIDPDDPDKQRYHDGINWTDNRESSITSARPFPGSDEVALLDLAESNIPAWRRVRVSTTETVPGSSIARSLGNVVGLIVNSRGPFSDTAAGVRTAVGGEVKSYSKLMTETRQEALDRLRQAAVEVGANAVTAMRYDTTALNDRMVEVAAYGTAVVLDDAPLPAPANSTAEGG